VFTPFPWSSMLWLELDPVFALAPYAILFCFLSRIRFYFLALLPFSSYFVCHALHCSPVLPSQMSLSSRVSCLVKCEAAAWLMYAAHLCALIFSFEQTEAKLKLFDSMVLT